MSLYNLFWMTTLGWYGNNVAYYQLISSRTSVALVCIQSERNSCAKKWKTRAWDKSSNLGCFLTSAQPANHNIRSLFFGRFWVIITQSTQMFQSCYHLTCTEVKDHVHNFSLVCYHATFPICTEHKVLLKVMEMSLVLQLELLDLIMELEEKWEDVQS